MIDRTLNAFFALGFSIVGFAVAALGYYELMTFNAERGFYGIGVGILAQLIALLMMRKA